MGQKSLCDARIETQRLESGHDATDAQYSQLSIGNALVGTPCLRIGFVWCC